jgi:hypothetical protein
MSILDNRYDLGDVAGSIIMYTSIAAWAGIGGATLYGHDLTSSAFTVEGWSVPMYVLGFVTATGIAFLTNSGLTARGLRRRPTWEKTAVVGTVGFPVLVDNVSSLQSLMLESHLNGTVFGLLALTGYVIVAFRRDRDKKVGPLEALRNAAGQGS